MPRTPARPAAGLLAAFLVFVLVLIAPGLVGTATARTGPTAQAATKSSGHRPAACRVRAARARTTGKAARSRAAARRRACRAALRKQARASRRRPHTTPPARPSRPARPATPVPPVPPAPPAGALTVGVNAGGTQVYLTPRVNGLGAQVARVEFGIGATAATIRPVVQAYADRGVRLVLLAGFAGTMPTTAQAQNLASWAAAFGPGGTFWATRSDGALAVREIEFGNETSYGYQYHDDYADASYAQRAQTYALRFKDAQVAIQSASGNSRLRLLAQGDDGDTGSSIWVDKMFAAVPDLASRVGGWTIHPYGPGWKSRIDRMNRQLAARGAPATIPIYVTEWGLATDNGRCLTDNYGWDRCMTYAAAASTLHTVLTSMRSAYPARLRQVLLYNTGDLQPSGSSTGREDYFGLLHQDGTDKGAYAAEVRADLAAYR